MQPSSGPDDRPRQREYCGSTPPLASCINLDNKLVCVEKYGILGRERLIYEHNLLQSADGSRSIRRNDQSLGHVKRIVKEKTQMAIRQSEDSKQMLILCTIEGEILRYVQYD